MTLARDPYLDLGLDGLRLIQASAGTGKTFTLATLVTRLVIERGLRVGQILAVTYTEAATQELRERLRLRLALAARIAAGELSAQDDDPERALTRTLIDAQLQYEDAAVLRHRLQRAAREIDLAAVFTIHGFCARVLTQHALETGQAFVAPEMIGSDRALRDEVATDLWRALGAEPLAAELLQAQWPAGPDALASDLERLLRTPRLLPRIPEPTPDPLPALEHAAATLRKAFALHGDAARAQLEAAIAGKVLNGSSYKLALPGELWSALDRWRTIGDATRAIDPRINRLSPQCLAIRTNKGKQAGTPASPLFDAVASYLAACDARDAWLAAHGIALVHRVRAEAAVRLAKLKRVRQVQTYDDLIDGVAVALESVHGAALAERLRAQYAVALVDEFQDTDARQWAIFEHVFGQRAPVDSMLSDSTLSDSTQSDSAQSDSALFLIGDPKQAIYRFRGGDVHTYLAAAKKADLAPPLAQNFRSRPALLRAIAALYAQAGASAFVDPRIRFQPVESGGGRRDGDFLRDGRTAPALTLRRLPPPDDGRKGAEWKAPESRRLATQVCVAAIHTLLHDARNARATIDGAAVQPGDIAVLVRKHDEAMQIQAALAAAGIPAVAAGRQSLFATMQAQELLALFEALLHPDDDGRLRAALATLLLGVGADTIARFDGDDTGHPDWQLRDWQLRALAWRERWQRHGPLALITDLCADNAPRLLGLVDGERRLTNLLQLGETLQEADARALGLHGMVDWLRTRIAEADANDETQQLRLESDAHRVQILTLHKSKGLEFPLVFLPFIGIGKESRAGRYCDYVLDDGMLENSMLENGMLQGGMLQDGMLQDGLHESGRVLQFKTNAVEAGMPVAGMLSWDQARARTADEERAEEARLLYVGLTRAQHAVWLACGPLYQAAATPLAAMLGDMAALRIGVDDDVQIDDGALAGTRLIPLSPEATGAVPPARNARRVLSRDWWVYSFTQLSNQASGGVDRIDPGSGTERGADDEPEPAPSLVTGDPRFSGSRFGNVLHDALEHVDFSAWRDCRGDTIPPGQAAPLRAALRGEGYVDADVEDGLPQLAALVGQTLNAALPEGVRLCELPLDARRAEMEFHFVLQSTAVDDVLALLHAHGLLRERQAFGLRRRLEGLMTGKIDLVYACDSRYYLLDYKSNRLPGYDAASLAAAMAHSEYDLQALIYTIALHRWLRFRLGENYDYARDFGGVRYLFCRGLDASLSSGDGIHADKPSQALVDALDALFNGVGP